MDLQVGVKALIKNTQGKYLLLHRSVKKYPEVDNLWDIAGGRIDPGTPLIENLKREIKEETDLNLVDNPTLIAAQDILKVANKHVVRLTFAATINGNPKLNFEEHDKFGWFSLVELKQLKNLDLYVQELIKDL